MDAAGDFGLRPAELRRVTEQVDGGAADRRQEHVQVGARHQLGEHAAGLLEQGAAEIGHGNAETARDAGQVPDGLDRGLGDAHIAGLGQHIAIRGQPAGADGGGDLRHVDVGAGDGDARPHILPGGNFVGEQLGGEVAPGIERDDRVRFAPLRERADLHRGAGVGQVRPVRRLQLAGGDGQRAIERVGAGMSADGVAAGGGLQRRHHGAARPRIRRAPTDRLGADDVARVRCQHDRAGHRAGVVGFQRRRGWLQWARPVLRCITLRMGVWPVKWAGWHGGGNGRV